MSSKATKATYDWWLKADGWDFHQALALAAKRDPDAPESREWLADLCKCAPWGTGSAEFSPWADLISRIEHVAGLEVGRFPQMSSVVCPITLPKTPPARWLEIFESVGFPFKGASAEAPEAVFPAWSEVMLVLTTNGVEIQHKAQIIKRISWNESQLGSKLSRMNALGKTLACMAEGVAQFPATVGKDKNRIYRLRKILREWAGVETDPFVVERKRYRPRFSLQLRMPGVREKDRATHVPYQDGLTSDFKHEDDAAGEFLMGK